MASIEEFFQVLAAKSRFEVVTHTLGANQLRIIGRVPSDESGQAMQNWLIIARNLLIAQEASPGWNVDISKQYFLKGENPNKKIVYGHRLVIQAPNIVSQLDSIIKVISESKQSSVVEVMSFPLSGARGDRNVGKNGGGVRPISGGR